MSCIRVRPPRSRGGVRAAFAAAVAMVAAAVAAAPAAVFLPRESRVPGGIAILDLGDGDEAPGTVVFNGYRTPVLRMPDGWVALVGIPLDAEPGLQTASWQPPGSEEQRRLEFSVVAKQYAERGDRDDQAPARQAGEPAGHVQQEYELSERIQEETYFHYRRYFPLFAFHETEVRMPYKPVSHALLPSQTRETGMGFRSFKGPKAG